MGPYFLIVKKIFKQTAWQLVGKIIISLSTLIVLSLIIRAYGKEGVGLFTLSLAYLSFFYLAADLGLNAFVLPRLKRDPNEVNKLFTARLYWSLILVILANFATFFLPFKTTEFKTAVFWGSFSIIGVAIFNSVNLIFQSKLRYDQSIISSSLEHISHLPSALILVFSKTTISFFPFIYSLGSIINNIVALILVRKFYKFKLEVLDLGYSLRILKEAWPISLTLILNTIYFRVDTFILSSFHPISVVGSYNLAYQIFQNILVLPTFIMNSFYPILISTYQENKNSFFSHIKIASLFLLGISLLGVLFTFLLSDFIIKVIAGSGFSESTTSLKILSLSFPAYFLSALFMWVFLVLKKYKTMLVIYLLGLLVNFILNLTFIPKYSFLAASYITGISEYLILALLIIILYFDLNSKK